MVNGEGGLLQLSESFGRSTSINKIEQDAFNNLQRTNDSTLALKLDPNFPQNEIVAK